MNNSKNVKLFVSILVLIVAIAIIVSCSVSCNNKKNENSCAYPNCTYSKMDGSNYCYDHRCPADGCTSPKSSNAKFCYNHTEGTGTIATKTAIVVKPRSVEDKGDVYWFNVGFKDTARTNTIFYGVLTIYNERNEKIYIASTGVTDCGAHKIKITFLSVKKSDIPSYDHYEWQALAAEPSKLGKQ